MMNNQTSKCQCLAPEPGLMGPTGIGAITGSSNPQAALIDSFLPGFSLFSSITHKYTGIDPAVYIPWILAIGLLIFGWQYAFEWLWDIMKEYFMSTADIRTDDEVYNMLMGFIAQQSFSKRARRFVANTNLNSRNWYLSWSSYYDEDSEDEDGDKDFSIRGKKKDKKVHFTPSFGTHPFWYKGHLFLFKRASDTQVHYGSISEREKISISTFGRNPAYLKGFLEDCRANFLSHDENRTVIYRGGLKPGSTEAVWTRCVSRVSRPFSTIVMDEKVKKELVRDLQDYLHPNTRRFYNNRGIPYRRGYLLSGPPGCGKSSLALAMAGFFNLKIYIVSLNSPSMTEEHLGTLFAELPQRCLVLLEDIDSSGISHSRAAADNTPAAPAAAATTASTTPPVNAAFNRISLSALLNCLDGVAAAEGRVLVMTTNHVEKLDKALIRPGRVDMNIKFKLTDVDMMRTLFKAIYGYLEGDKPTKEIKEGESDKDGLPKPDSMKLHNSSGPENANHEKHPKLNDLPDEDLNKNKEQDLVRLEQLSQEFAAKIPSEIFSPAEIQGYLLKWKSSPESAIANADEWVVSMKEQKEKEQKEKEQKEKENKDKIEKEGEKQTPCNASN
ncbi:BCS1 N terminal-domain-containing protein [Xylogone sp. PMI_703]|nr:BCS1 N terminal-domain-containing protein [Xylogone sp. PMI_703]